MGLDKRECNFQDYIIKNGEQHFCIIDDGHFLRSIGLKSDKEIFYLNKTVYCKGLLVEPIPSKFEDLSYTRILNYSKKKLNKIIDKSKKDSYITNSKQIKSNNRKMLNHRDECESHNVNYFKYHKLELIQKSGQYTKNSTDLAIIPLEYQCYFEILSQSLTSAPPCATIKLLSHLVELKGRFLVRKNVYSIDYNESDSVLVKAGEVLILMDKITTKIQTKYWNVKEISMICCNMSNGTTVYFEYEQKGLYSPIADHGNFNCKELFTTGIGDDSLMDNCVFEAKKLAEFCLPIHIKLIDVNGTKTRKILKSSHSQKLKYESNLFYEPFKSKKIKTNNYRVIDNICESYVSLFLLKLDDNAQIEYNYSQQSKPILLSTTTLIHCIYPFKQFNFQKYNLNENVLCSWIKRQCTLNIMNLNTQYIRNTSISKRVVCNKIVYSSSCSSIISSNQSFVHGNVNKKGDTLENSCFITQNLPFLHIEAEIDALYYLIRCNNYSKQNINRFKYFGEKFKCFQNKTHQFNELHKYYSLNDVSNLKQLKTSTPQVQV
ncbi:hypothetical protein A3Q56_05457 [Intoshia linei]|uniref:CABIT domain-containing protein n=1 Tax=Intoshia linei TaxID=1819745 RepID=A0A177AXW8_9BILA|nr:hypothetical protein A3Q56_05457 [Intoshia linei]